MAGANAFLNRWCRNENAGYTPASFKLLLVTDGYLQPK